MDLIFVSKRASDYVLIGGTEPAMIVRSCVRFTVDMLKQLDDIGGWEDGMRLIGHNDEGGRRVVVSFVPDHVLRVVETSDLTPMSRPVYESLHKNASVETRIALMNCFEKWDACEKDDDSVEIVEAPTPPLPPLGSQDVKETKPETMPKKKKAPTHLRPGDLVEYSHHVLGAQSGKVFSITKSYNTFTVEMENGDLLS